jgi:uncharacterized protein
MSPLLESLGYVLAVALVLLGLVGTVFPALPGTPLTFAGLWLAAWLGRYERVGGIVVGILAVVTVVSLALDFIAGMLGAERAGASRFALWGATLGSVLGLAFGFPGVIFGPFLGAALGEYWARRDVIRAGHVAVATWLGILIGTLAKVALSWMMIGIFVVAWFF